MESSYHTISKLPASAIANMITLSPSLLRKKSVDSLPMKNPTDVTSVKSTSPIVSAHKIPVSQQPNLVSIDLAHKGLTVEKLTNLISRFSALQSCISTLKLGFNDLKDDGAIMISSLLQKGSTSIVCLDLGFCSIGDAGVQSLASVLMFNRSLKTLYLSGNLITEVGFHSLGNALASNKTLKCLFLTGNAGKDRGLKYLSKGLLFNSCLEKLFTNGNKIECDGITFLSDTLRNNFTLSCLNLVSIV
jgi:Ran GTPase-activating protein (RanGAP) involved in mRNA processing and transport